MPGGVAYDAQEPPLLLVELPSGLLRQLGDEAVDREEGVAQVVGDGGGEGLDGLESRFQLARPDPDGVLDAGPELTDLVLGPVGGGDVDEGELTLGGAPETRDSIRRNRGDPSAPGRVTSVVSRTSGPLATALERNSGKSGRLSGARCAEKSWETASSRVVPSILAPERFVQRIFPPGSTVT